MRKKVIARYRGKAVLHQLAIGAAVILCGSCRRLGAASNRYAGFTERKKHGQQQATAGTRPEIRWHDQGWRSAVEILVAATRCAAEGRAQRAADHHR